MRGKHIAFVTALALLLAPGVAVAGPGEGAGLVILLGPPAVVLGFIGALLTSKVRLFGAPVRFWTRLKLLTAAFFVLLVLLFALTASQNPGRERHETEDRKRTAPELDGG